MDWEKFKKHWVGIYYIKCRSHPLLPLFAAVAGWVGGKLMDRLTQNPNWGASAIAISIFLALVMWIPWDKIASHAGSVPRPALQYGLSIIVCLVLGCALWGYWTSLFREPDPYLQPLRTCTATVEIFVRSDWNGEGQGLGGDCGDVMLATKDIPILVMTASTSNSKQIGNHEARYRATSFSFAATDKSVGHPVSHLLEAEHALVRVASIPDKSQVTHGTVTFAFNDSILVKIPIPPQVTEQDTVTINDVRQYLQAGR
jgi:hypothetical protein